MNPDILTTSNLEPRRPWLQRETTGLMLILLAFLLVNLLVATRTPTVFNDEPQHTDPAANLYFGSGFTSTMWGQDRHDFWCGYVPLYDGVLFGWFKVFGFGFFQARALSTVLTAAGGFLIWAALRRTAFIAKPANRLLCLALVLSGSASTQTFRTIRPDALMFFVCALVFFACCLPVRWRWRHLLIILFGALLPAAGFALLPYAGLLLLITLAVYGWASLRPLAAIAAGLLAGGAALVAFYHHFATVTTFVNLFLPTTSIGQTGVAFWRAKIFGTWPGDFNLITSFFGNPLELMSKQQLFDHSAALLFLLVILFARPKMWRRADGRTRRFIIFIGAVTLLVPPFLHFTGHYPSYYRWMTYVPLAVAVPRLWEMFPAAAGPVFWRRIFLGVTGLSLFLGVPGRTLAILPSWPTRSTTPIDQVAAKMVRPTDVVFCSYKVYYSVRPHARLVYAYGSFVVEFLKNFPAQDFSLLCLAPDEVDSAMKIVGGHWEKVPLEQMPEAAALGRTRYAVDFYRRSSN